MNRHKKLLAVAVAAALLVSTVTPAFAADSTTRPQSVSSATQDTVSAQPERSSSEANGAVSSAPEVSSSPEESRAASAQLTASIRSDTTVGFSLTQTATYTFRFDVEGPQGLNPKLYVENSSVLQVEKTVLETQNGHDTYFFTVRAVGQAGQSSSVYTMLPGQKPVRQCAITVGQPYVKSDTTVDFSVAKDNTYAFRFEIIGPRGLQPNIAAGNGKVLRTEETRRVVENEHDVYYFKVRAIGNVGEASGIYTTLPGQKAVKHCTIKVAPLTGHQKINGKWYYLDANSKPRTGWIEADGKRYYGMPDGHLQTGWLSFGSNYYYCTSDGSLAKGWLQIGTYRYYFNPTTGLKATNTTVNGIHLGYSGRTSTGYQSAARVLNSVGWNLRSAFNWSAGLRYKSTTSNPSPGAEWFANYGFNNKCGNCYVMASTFYYMADLLGYNARQMTGLVPLAAGGFGPHSWCEIGINGATYVFDPDFTHETGRNGYQIHYGMSGTWRYTSYKSMT